LELTGVVGRGWLAGETARAGCWVAELVHGQHIEAVEQVEAVGDQVEMEALTDGNGFGDAQIDLEEAGRGEGIAAEIAVAACGRTYAGNGERRAVVRQAGGSQSERDAGDERRTGGASD